MRIRPMRHGFIREIQSRFTDHPQIFAGQAVQALADHPAFARLLDILALGNHAAANEQALSATFAELVERILTHLHNAQVAGLIAGLGGDDYRRQPAFVGRHADAVLLHSRFNDRFSFTRQHIHQDFTSAFQGPSFINGAGAQSIVKIVAGD